MARTGTRPEANKVTGQPSSKPLEQTQTAPEQNYINSKATAAGLNEAWSSAVKFDDQYFPDVYTMTGNIEYTVDPTNAGTGNGRKDTVIGNGGTATFTGFSIIKSDLTPAGQVVTTVNGKSYNFIFLRVGAISEVYIIENGISAVTPTLTTPTLSAVAGDEENVLTLSAIDGNSTGGVLEFDTDPGFGTVAAVPGWTYPTSPYTHLSLTNGTAYYYRFKTTAAGYNDSAYATDNATPLGQTLPQITGLTSTDKEFYDVRLNWNAPSGNGANLSVKRSEVMGGPYTEIATPTPSATSYIDTTAVIGTNYYYVVQEIGDGVTYLDGLESAESLGVAGFTNSNSMIIDVATEGDHTIQSNLLPIGAGNFDGIFSIEIWFKPTAIATQNAICRVGDLDDASKIVISTLATGEIYFRKRNTSGNETIYTTAVDYGTTDWHQIIVTHPLGTSTPSIKIYLDGVEIASSRTENGTYPGFFPINGDVTLELPIIAGTYGDGKYNLFRMYNVELSAGGVTSLYNSGVPIGVGDPSLLLIEKRFNNDHTATIGNNGTPVGSPTFDTDIPV